MPTPPFGDLFLSSQFDDAVIAFIARWIDTHLSEVELLSDLPRRTLDRPKSYNVAIEPEAWPAEKMPGILVVSAGFTDQPERIGGGRYNGWWSWVAVAILSASDYDSTRKKTQMYQAAMRQMFMQHPNLDGAVSDTEWLGEPTAYVPVDTRNRTLGVAAFEFRSYIEGVVDEGYGPTAPDAAPPLVDPNTPHNDDFTVVTVDIDLVHEPIGRRHGQAILRGTTSLTAIGTVNG
jgi:hypothetical protein